MVAQETSHCRADLAAAAPSAYASAYRCVQSGRPWEHRTRLAVLQSRSCSSLTLSDVGSHFETGSKARPPFVAPAVPQVFAVSMQAEQSLIVDPKSPGGINSPHGLILFDGVCVLCSRGCQIGRAHV